MRKLLVIVFLVFVVPAFAVRTFYIDFSGGSDATSVANAQSKSTPWKHQPYMTGSTISGYSHTAGDRFIFKGGVTWDHTCFPLAITSGGNSTNSDYYGVDATWYTGGSWVRPIWDNEYVACSSHRVIIQVSYVQIDNIEIKRLFATSDISTRPALLTVYGGGPTNQLVTNSYVHGWKTDVNSDGAYGGIIVGTSNPPQDFTLDNTEVENSENANVLTTGASTTSVTVGSGSKTFTVTGGLTVSAGQYVQVFSSASNLNRMGGYVTSFSGGSLVVNVTTVAGSGTFASWTPTGPYTASGLAVADTGIIQNGCRIHDCSSGVLYTLDFNGSYLYNITGDGFDLFYHYNGIYSDPYGWNNTVRTGYIRNSFLHDCSNGANMAYPNTRGGATCLVYNNVLYGVMSSQLAVEIDPLQYSGEGTGNMIAYNNTIYNYDSGATAFNVVARAQKVGTLTLYNNHVINALSLTNSDGTNTTSYVNGNNLSQSAATATSQGYVLANLYAPTGTGVGTYNTGTSESGTFTTDILGITRPQAGVWDIGAYEYVSGATTIRAIIGGSAKIGGQFKY